jgi:hypothetical protein
MLITGGHIPTFFHSSIIYPTLSIAIRSPGIPIVLGNSLIIEIHKRYPAEMKNHQKHQTHHQIIQNHTKSKIHEFPHDLPQRLNRRSWHLQSHESKGADAQAPHALQIVATDACHTAWKSMRYRQGLMGCFSMKNKELSREFGHVNVLKGAFSCQKNGNKIVTNVLGKSKPTFIDNRIIEDNIFIYSPSSQKYCTTDFHK